MRIELVPYMDPARPDVVTIGEWHADDGDDIGEEHIDFWDGETRLCGSTRGGKTCGGVTVYAASSGKSGLERDGVPKSDVKAEAALSKIMTKAKEEKDKVKSFASRG